MGALLKSFFYKLFRDNTFRIVVSVGAGLSLIFSIIYCFLIKEFLGCGAYAFVSSISPSQNFGFAIPINLALFVVILFNQGIIRNQIIVGNSKAKVYFSLLIGGVVFVLSVLVIYVGLTTLFCTIFRGFYNNLFTSSFLNGSTILRIIIITLVNYILITTYVVFIASISKSNGVAISMTVIPIIALSVASMVITLMGQANQVNETVLNINKYVNPQYLMGRITGLLNSLSNGGKIAVSDSDLTIGLINNAVYIGLFTLVGTLVFRKMDLK